MIRAKKKRLIIVASTIAAAVIVPNLISVPFYIKSFSDKVDITVQARYIPELSLIKDGKVSSDNSVSNIDNHLELIKEDEVVKPITPKIDPHANSIVTSITPKPQPVEEKPKPDEEVAIIAKDEKKDEEEKVNKDPVEGEKLEKTKPDPEPRDVTVNVDGEDLKVTVRDQPERTRYKSDIENKIANRVEYIADITPDVLNVVVTEPFVKKTLGAVRDKIKGEFARTASIIGTPQSSMFSVEGWFKVNGDPNVEYYFNVLKKNLLDKPNFADYLLDQARPIYPDKKKEFSKPEQKYQLYGWMIANIDWSKIPLSKNALEALSRGDIIQPNGAYINENGEFDSHVSSPLPGYNKVTNRMTRDNKEKRVFGYNNWYTRSPKSIYDGTYEGWEKIRANDEFKGKYNVNPETDGINFFRLKNDNKEFEKNNNGLVVELDASNASGYKKTLDLVKSLKRDNVKVTSYRIFNMGSKDSSQKFLDIMKELPDELPQLELFFESTNTAALIGLENKKIDELSLYTTGNSLLPEWSINPFAIRNVAFVNTLDYNVSKSYRPGARIPTRITFDAIAFDPVNYKKGEKDPYKEMNLALRMALFTRNNEPFFQGGFGPGLKPDHNEGGNSYPVGLDLSRVPEMKSLRGLQYSFIKDGKQFDRKVRILTLYSDKPTFEISVQEMIDSQFNKVMYIPGPPNPGEERLRFSGPKVKNIHLSGTGTLQGAGSSNLETFIKHVGRTYFDSSLVLLVDKNNQALLDQLKGMGYKVKFISEDETLPIN
ncbi:putative immunoglobulin-blocking virulence protein [Mycoplasmopsis alligatoris]|uniref:Membrane family protein n=1 Tax=Mycoplasmopsis alligatoris A21JP2 TaxID=747682 RepID=D4XVD0_9BACT|nr:putative immunoglobulin-blocking virulence protein [Mycoplasmopsis alligatoris]EFF41610.1 membrane family protein [Mycoplasmopsis alligatoris A21JP2]